MRFEIGPSQRAYATRRGVTSKAVRKAIASGFITEVVMPDGTITTNHSDRLWEANASTNQRHEKGRSARPRGWEGARPLAKFVLNCEQSG